MRIALLNTKETLRARYLLESFAEGARQHGDTCYWIDKLAGLTHTLAPADVGVQVCYPNKHHKNVEQAIFRQEVNIRLHAAGKRVISVDTGFVRNQSDYELKVGAPNRKHEVLFDIDKKETYEAVLRDVYYELGYDGLKGNADYCNAGSPPDRWLKLETPLVPWRTNGQHILIIGQTLHGLSSQHVDIYEWYGQIVRKLRQHTEREIVFRHHPRIIKIRGERSRVDKDRGNLVKHLPQGLTRWGYSKGWFLEDDLHDAWAAITFTSNGGVTAAIQGIPVFAGDPASMAWPVANNDLSAIEKPGMPDRQQWAYDLAYGQFNAAELKSGEAWTHLRPHALKPPTRLRF